MTKTNVPASDILEQHKVKLNFKSVPGERAKYKALAESLYAEVEIQKHRMAAIAGSLNAAFSNYQAASQGLKQLQAGQAELAARLEAFGAQFAANGIAEATEAEGTETKGE